MKKKLSATIEDDAFDLLAKAARSEGVSVSEMLERAVRLACSGYRRHTIRCTWLENGGCSIEIAAGGKAFFRRRAARRHDEVAVRGRVDIEFDGPVDADAVIAALERFAGPGAARPRPAEGGVRIALHDVPPNAERDERFVRDLLSRTATAIGAAEATRVADVSKHPCPECGVYLSCLNVWAAPDDPHEREEREWICGAGHRISGAGRTPRRSASDAFASLGAWEGESEKEIQKALKDARRRGGSRRVPQP